MVSLHGIHTCVRVLRERLFMIQRERECDRETQYCLLEAKI